MSPSGQRPAPFCAAPDWPGRGLAVLRALAFFLLSAAFVLGPMILVAQVLVSASALGSLEVGLAIHVTELGLGVLAATALMARVDGRRIGAFGLGGGDRVRNLVVGITSGVLAMALMLLAVGLASSASYAPAAPVGGATVLYALYYVAVMLGAAFAEETLCRGYALVALAEGISFWPAALATGMLFALLHAGNGGETAPGLAFAALFGIVLASSYRHTGSLWFAYGFHAGWDYAETFIFGVPNSGALLPGSLLHLQFRGPSWLTGGSAGPEGSVLILAILGATLVVVRKFLRPAGWPAAPPGAAASDPATRVERRLE